MAVAVVGHSPTGLRTVVAVVADALAFVEVGTYGGGVGAAAHAAVLLRHVLVCVVHESVADVVDVDIVGFAAVVAVACTFVGTDADALVEPSEAFFHVAFVVEHFVDMSLNVLNALHRETTGKHFKVVVAAFQLAKPVVGTTAAHRVGGEVGIVANEEDELKVALGVGVDAVDVVLDLGVVVAAGFGHADHRRGTARLVFPVYERLHGLHVLVGADDEHLSAVLFKVILRRVLFVVDEAVVVGSFRFG